MQFDYMICRVNRQFLKKLESRPAELGRAEIEQRARLLLRLNYTKAQAIRRISDNIAWEYELSTVPPFGREVRDIVESVYKGAVRGA